MDVKGNKSLKQFMSACDDNICNSSSISIRNINEKQEKADQTRKHQQKLKEESDAKRRLEELEQTKKNIQKIKQQAPKTSTLKDSWD
jgi:hypothetical protein